MLTPYQCRTARRLLRMSSEQLADSAQINERTVTDFENDTRAPHPATLQAMARILALGGVDFYKDGTASLEAVMNWGPAKPLKCLAPVLWASRRNADQVGPYGFVRMDAGLHEATDLTAKLSKRMNRVLAPVAVHNSL